MPAATAQFHRAGLLAMRGDLEAALELFDLARGSADQFGVLGRMMVGMEGAEIFMLAGDPASALDVVRGSYDLGGQLGETGWRATVGGFLAEALFHVGQLDEAEAIACEVERFASPDDFEPHSRLCWVRAGILSRRGEVVEAERLAREAVALVDGTDWFDQRGCAHSALGDVLAAAGRRDEAADEWRTALDLFERKGDVVRAVQVRELLA
jgi:Flp pilus assembly protein TadD